MGALHAGHVSLVEAAREAADRVVATIFVNPKQFAPGEDFAAYPRDLEADRARVAAAGADLVYAPELPAMYPEGFCTSVSLGGPALAGLEDRFRPDHFAGVATVVTKLLLQALPDIALFGEKDWQQLKVIERLVRDLDVPVSCRAGRRCAKRTGSRCPRATPTSMRPSAVARRRCTRRLSACAAALARGAAARAGAGGGSGSDRGARVRARLSRASRGCTPLRRSPPPNRHGAPARRGPARPHAADRQRGDRRSAGFTAAAKHDRVAP